MFLLHKFQDMLAAFEPEGKSRPDTVHDQGTQWIGWEPPDEGWMVLNTDGAVKKQSDCAGAGGVIRDRQGDWVVGFSEFLGYCSPIKAELRGILRGLTIAKERRVPKLLVRSDSMQVVSILNAATVNNRENIFLIQQCRQLLGWTGWTVKVSHCLREANQVADKLATIGSEGRLGLTILAIPPSEVHELLYADSRGFSWPRRSCR